MMRMSTRSGGRGRSMVRNVRSDSFPDGGLLDVEAARSGMVLVVLAARPAFDPTGRLAGTPWGKAVRQDLRRGQARPCLSLRNVCVAVVAQRQATTVDHPGRWLGLRGGARTLPGVADPRAFGKH